LSSTKRETLKSLLVSAAPCATRSSLNLTSCVDDIGQQAEAHGVGAVGGSRPGEHGPPLDEVDGIDAGAQRLGHAPPVGRLDDRVDVDVAERHVAGELEAEHHHPRDPQEQDVAAVDRTSVG
jgi:hypothetical protein